MLAPDEIQLARRFEPLLHLHPKEVWRPVSATDFALECTIRGPGSRIGTPVTTVERLDGLSQDHFLVVRADAVASLNPRMTPPISLLTKSLMPGTPAPVLVKAADPETNQLFLWADSSIDDEVARVPGKFRSAAERQAVLKRPQGRVITFETEIADDTRSDALGRSLLPGVAGPVGHAAFDFGVADATVTVQWDNPLDNFASRVAGRLSKELFESVRSVFRKHMKVPRYHFRIIGGSGDNISLEYLFLWPYNDWGTSHDGFNDHEGDRERVRIHVRDGVVQRAHISAHHTFRSQSEATGLTVRDGHPVLYVAGGSHAHYLQPGTYPSLGFDDVASSAGQSIGPAGLATIQWGEPLGIEAWMADFRGGWGARLKRFGRPCDHISGPHGKWYE